MRAWRQNLITMGQSLRFARQWRGRASLLAPGLFPHSGARILNDGGAREPASKIDPQDVILALRDAARALEAGQPQGRQHLRSLSQQLRFIDLDALEDVTRRKAFFINLYNVLMVDAVVDFEIRHSVMERPEIFSMAAYRIGSQVWTLDAIEHGILRGNRPHPRGNTPPLLTPQRQRWSVPLDARVHMALVCGAVSCPAIRAYEAEHLDAQLTLAAQSFVEQECQHLDASRPHLALSLLFAWYRQDFIDWTRHAIDGGVQGDEAIWRFLAHHASAQARARIELARRQPLVYKPYDWRWNRV